LDTPAIAAAAGFCNPNNQSGVEPPHSKHPKPRRSDLRNGTPGTPPRPPIACDRASRYTPSKICDSPSFSKGGSAMKALLSTVLGLAVVLALVVKVQARDDKEVTLKGTITCAKCDLKEADKCATVIKVEKDGKDVVYYFDDSAHKKNHKKICTDPKKGSVTGTVGEKDGKKTIKVTKVDFE
jgi:hypothetical protein